VHFAGDDKHSARKAGHQVKNNMLYKWQEKAGDCSIPVCLVLDTKKKKKKNQTQKTGLWFVLELGINFS